MTLRAVRGAPLAAALTLPPRRTRSFLGQAWKGDKENPQSNAAATKTILATVAIYACFLGLSSARPPVARRLAAARWPASAPRAAAAPTLTPCVALSRPFPFSAVLCFMGHAAKRKIKPETTRRRAA